MTQILQKLHLSRKQNIAVYNEKYRRQAHLPEGQPLICWACSKEVQYEEIIYVDTKNKSTKRRHVTCAVQKNCITKEQAKGLIDQVCDDMDIAIPAALKKFFI